MTEEQKIRRRESKKAYKAAHPLTYIWSAMLQRCGHQKGASAQQLSLYAGRGIIVCDEWRHFRPFEAWCLANGWEKGLQLDRINNNGPYSPENCRFVTQRENLLNRHNTVLAAGIPLATWYDAYKAKMDELSLTYMTVLKRFTNGWSLEESLFTPLQKRRSA